MARAVQYVKHGDPKEVLRLVEPSSFRHLTRGDFRGTWTEELCLGLGDDYYHDGNHDWLESGC